MQLVVDSGNSFVKCYVFSNHTILDYNSFEYSETSKIQDFITQYPEISRAIECNVSGVENSILSMFPNIAFSYFTHATPIPIINNYESKTTLGLDRLAAAVGAETVLPNSNKLIIDLGTAITIDFVSKNQTFEGGNISLGLQSRFNALHTFTGKLPQLFPENSITLTAKNTHQAIQNGVIQGILFEIEGYISAYNTIYSDISVFLTGGDAFFFEKMVKNHIFANQNLVLIGLNRIINYNA